MEKLYFGLVGLVFILPLSFSYFHPEITSASVHPEKVVPGDIMAVEAEVQDWFGISSVTADMGGIEGVELEHLDGSTYKGRWGGDWFVHDTLIQDYTTVIKATNQLGLSSYATISWSDPPASNASINILEETGYPEVIQDVDNNPIEIRVNETNGTGDIANVNLTINNGEDVPCVETASDLWSCDWSNASKAAGNYSITAWAYNSTGDVIANDSINLSLKNISISVNLDRHNVFNQDEVVVTGSVRLRPEDTNVTDTIVYVWIDGERAWQTWNSSYRYERPINMTNTGSQTLNNGTTVNITFDHSALVSSGKSLASGNDVRITWYNETGQEYVELDRHNSTSFNTTNTNIWFKIKDDIPAGGSDGNYTLHYGNPSAALPPSDQNAVFMWSPPLANVSGMWHMEEGQGSTVTDSSGKGNSGTIYGTIWNNDGRFGRGLVFDGVDDYVEVANSDSLNITDEITISAWVKCEKNSGGYQQLDTDGASKSASSSFLWNYPSNAFDGNTGTWWETTSGVAGQWLKIQFPNPKIVTKIRLYHSAPTSLSGRIEASNDNGNWTILKSFTHPNKNTWYTEEFSNTDSYIYYRLYFTSSGSSLQIQEWELYESETVNIVDKGDGSYSMKINSNCTELFGYITGKQVNATISPSIGFRHFALTYNGTRQGIYIDGVLKGSTFVSGGIGTTSMNLSFGRNFNGTIDEIAIYNRALSAEEITTLYASTNPYVTLGGVRRATDSTGTYNISIYPDVVSGPHILKVNITNSNGITGENSTPLYVYGYSNLSAISFPSSVYRGVEPVYCKVNDANSSSVNISEYPVNFYDNGTFLGTSSTNSSGWAVWNWNSTNATVGSHTLKCNITANTSLYYNRTAVAEVTTTTTVRRRLSLDLTVAPAEVFRNDSFSPYSTTMRAHVTDEIDNVLGVEVEFRIPGDPAYYKNTSGEGVATKLYNPSDSKTPGVYTITANTTALPDPYSDPASDTVNLTILGKLISLITSPPDGTIFRKNETIILNSTFREANGDAVQVNFSWTLNGSEVSTQGNDSWRVPVNYTSGVYELNITSWMDGYYGNGSDSITVEIWGYLITINSPANGTEFYKSTGYNNVTMNATARDERNQSGVDLDLTWYLDGVAKAAGNVTSWVIQDSEVPGLYELNAIIDGLPWATNSTFIEIYGWSNLSEIILPGGEVLAGEGVPVGCYVNDSNSSAGIGGYPVKFYKNGSLNATNITDSNGLAMWYWDTSGDNGTYEIKCSITANDSLYYRNVSVSGKNGSVTVTRRLHLSDITRERLTLYRKDTYTPKDSKIWVRVLEGKLSAVSGATVHFSTDTEGEFATCLTNSTGWCSITYNPPDNIVPGIYNVYINTTKTGKEPSTTNYTFFVVKGELYTFSTIDEPSTPIWHRTDDVPLWATIREENGSITAADDVRWYNESNDLILNAEDGTWTVPADYGLGNEKITIRATREFYDNYTEWVTIQIYGWANATWISPTGTLANEQNLTLLCSVTDANTSEALAGYPVEFYYNQTLIDSNTTNGSGYAVISSWEPGLGTYQIKCNISDNSSLMYDAAVSESGVLLFIKDMENPAVWSGSVTPASVHLHENATIEANVTDNVNVSLVWARVEWDTSEANVTLENAGGSIFRSNYTATAAGTHNVTIYANDTGGNINSSFGGQFYVPEVTTLTIQQNASVQVSGVDNSTGKNILLDITINNTGPTTAYYTSINISTPGGWATNSTSVSCGNLTSGAVCLGTFNITIPAGTRGGNYTINGTGIWENPDGSTDNVTGQTTVEITRNWHLNLTHTYFNATLLPAAETTLGTFYVQNLGNSELEEVYFNKTAGNLSESWAVFLVGPLDNQIPVVYAGGQNQTVLNVTIPTGTCAGFYNATYIVNATANCTGTCYKYLTVEVTVENDTRWSLSPTSMNKTLNVSTSGFLTNISINNTGNIGLNFSIVESGNGSNITILSAGSILVQNQTVENLTINYSVPLDQPFGDYTVNITIANSSVDPVEAYVILAITVEDNIKPNVTDASVSLAMVEAVYGSVAIAANVTDNINVSTVWANVTNSTGENVTVSMTWAGGDRYNASYTPSEGGEYSVTVFANDTFGNRDSTFAGTFNATGATTGLLSQEPQSVTASGITTTSNYTFTITVTLNNTGNATMRNANLSLELVSGFYANSTFKDCGNITKGSSCGASFLINVTTEADPAVNTIIGRGRWTNPDQSQGMSTNSTSVDVPANSFLELSKTNLSGSVDHWTSRMIGSFYVQSKGNMGLSNVLCTNTSGNLSGDWIDYIPSNSFSSIMSGDEELVEVNVTVPAGYPPSNLWANITCNASGTNCGGGNCRKNITVDVDVPSNHEWSREPPNRLISVNTTATGAFNITIMNLGNMDLNFTVTLLGQPYSNGSKLINPGYPRYVFVRNVSSTNVTFYYDATQKGGGFWLVNLSFKNSSGTPESQLNSHIYFNILDAAPRIENVSVYPMAVEAGETFNISADVTDDYNEVDTVWANITTTQGTVVTYMASTGGNTYNATYTPSIGGNHTVVIYANDTVGNLNSTTAGTVEVTGNTTGTLTQDPTMVTASGITISNNHTFTLTLTLNNTGSGTMAQANLSLSLPTGFYANSTLENCGAVAAGSSCTRSFEVNVTTEANIEYNYITGTGTWENPDQTTGEREKTTTVYVESNPVLEITEDEVATPVDHGYEATVGSFTIQNAGNTYLYDVNCSEAGGNLPAAWIEYLDPRVYAAISKGGSEIIRLNVSIPYGTPPGNYWANVTCNATGSDCTGTNCWDNVTLNVTVPVNYSCDLDQETMEFTVDRLDTGSFNITVNNRGNAELNLSVQPSGNTTILAGYPKSIMISNTSSKNATFSYDANVDGGDYVINIKFLNASASPTENTSVVTITVIDHPPRITIYSPGNITYNQTDWIDLNYSTVDETGTDMVWYSLDNGSNETLTGNTTVYNLSNGGHCITVYTNDTEGNLNSSTVCFTNNLDIMPPNITLYLPENRTYDGDWTYLNFSVVDDIGVAWTGYNLDYNTTNTTIPGNANTTIENLSDGHHYLMVYVEDTSGNTNSSSVNFTVDTTPPVINIASPINNSIYNSNSIPLNFTVFDNHSTINSTWYSLDGDQNKTSGNTSLNISGDGSHNVTVYANDSLGFTNSLTVYFTVDTTLPTITIASPQNKTYSNTPIDLNVSADEATDTWLYNINNTENVTFTPNKTDNFSEGQNNVTVWVNDTAGNWNYSIVYFTVDITPPSVTIISPTNTSINDSTPLLNVTFDEQINTAWISVDGAEGQNYTSGVTNLTFDLGQLLEGLHNVTVYANDSVGNLNSSTVSFTVDTTPPTVNVYSPSNMSYNTPTVNLNYTSFDSQSLDTVDGGLNNTLTGNTTLGGLSEGSHSVTVYANDSVGNLNSTTVSFTVDTTAPIITPLTPVDRDFVSGIIDIIASVTDNLNLDTTLWKWSNTTESSQWYGLNGTLLTTDLQDGNYNITYWANDTASNWNQTNVTITIDNTHPAWIVVLETSITINPGESFIYYFNATDNFGYVAYTVNDTTNFTINGSTGVLTNATNLPIGLYYFHVNATDAAGNVNTTEMLLSVGVDIDPPLITLIQSPPGNTVILNTSFNLIWNIMEESPSFYWITDNNNTVGVNAYTNGQNISWPINTSSIGVRNYTLYANDSSSNNASNTVVITVIQDTTPPVITGTILESTEPGKNTTIKVNVTDNIGVDRVVAEVAYPNSTTLENLSMLHLSGDTWSVEFGNTTDSGDYHVAVYAYDLDNNTDTSEGWFGVYNTSVFNGIFQDSNGANITAWFRFYKPGTNFSLFSFSTTSSKASYNKTLSSREYDLEIRTIDNILKLQNANLSLGGIDLLKLDNVPTSAIGQKTFKAIAVENSIPFSQATITLNYSGTSYDRDDWVGVYRCSNWIFSNRTCSSGWTRIGGTRNGDETISVNVSSFSAYVAAQYIVGDGVCDSSYGESVGNSPIDCKINIPSPSSSGGGGGGGGVSTSKFVQEIENITQHIKSLESSITSEFKQPILSVSTEIIEISLKPGEVRKTTIGITNNKNEKTVATISPEGEILDYLSLETHELEIGPKSTGYVQAMFRTDEQTSPGVYTGGIIVTAGELTRKVYVIMNVEPEEVSRLDIKISTLMDKVKPGSLLRAAVNFYNLGLTREIDAIVTYSIKSIETGESLLTTQESLSIEDSLTITRDIEIPEDTPEGVYVLEALGTYEGKTVSAVSTFRIGKQPWVLSLFWSLALSPFTYLVLLFGLVAYYGRDYYRMWKQRKMEKAKYVFPVDFNKLPKGVKVGKIAETDTDAYFDLNKLTMHMISAGGTGSGKSVSAQVMAEEALKKGIPVIVFDPTAQWSGFVKACRDKHMLDLYPQFGMTPEDARAFKGTIVDVDNPEMEIDISKYTKKGEITVFVLNKLTPTVLDAFVTRTIDNIFEVQWPEARELKLLIIYDEVHRLMPKYGGKRGYKALERGCREFRKWGIGLIMASQVLADFRGTIRAVIATEMQLRTKYDGDISRVKTKFGPKYAETLPRLQIGTALIQNPEYNDGKPWFISFRPLQHDTSRIPEEELQQYKKFNRIIKALERKIEQLKAEGVDTYDLEIELNLARDKLKEGNVLMTETYIESLTGRIEVAEKGKRGR
jgi:hypothetical protein